mmetsp:Transcript_6363/g.23966  ORF Transcript_6363/g.23966 Transcript_6363/m.23966 type:complete len:126 (+) Transcript_6363:833-1210(+)
MLVVKVTSQPIHTLRERDTNLQNGRESTTLLDPPFLRDPKERCKEQALRGSHSHFEMEALCESRGIEKNETHLPKLPQKTMEPHAGFLMESVVSPCNFSVELPREFDQKVGFSLSCALAPPLCLT